MGTQQVIKIEYALLKYLNRIRISGILATIEFVPGKAWEEIKFTSGTGVFSEKPKQSDGGISYSQELKCNIVSDNKEMLSMIDILEHSDVVVRVMYNSGEWKVIGIQNIPANLTTEINVEKSGGYKLTFSSESINRSCFLNN